MNYEGTRHMTHRTFLSAAWRYIAMLNYKVPPQMLHPYVPQGTELDWFGTDTYVSMVGFQFLNSRLYGIPAALHRKFEEVNLRFYVRRQVHDGTRRAVVFIKEIVPRRAVAAVARRLYNENYQVLPMRHQISGDNGKMTVDYDWYVNNRWNQMHICALGASRAPDDGSLESFISEHFWAYSVQRDGGTLEYRVEHPR